MAKIPFYGIVAVGNTKQDAVSQYRDLAKGKSVSVFVDAGKSISFVSNSSALAHVFNPSTGDMDMTENKQLQTGLSFASESSSEDREVNHYECKSSCGGHVVYDAATLLKFCPICTATVSESDADESDEDEAEDDSLDLGMAEGDEEGDEAEDEGDESESDDAEEDDESAEDDSDAEDADEEDSEEDSEEDDSEEGDSEEGADEEESEDDEPVVVAAASKAEAMQIYMKHRATALASGEATEVDYMVCSSDTCGVHIIAECAVDACPVCDSKLKDPATTTASDDEDESLDLPEDSGDEEEDGETEDTGEDTGESDEGDAETEEGDAESEDDEGATEDEAGEEADASATPVAVVPAAPAVVSTVVTPTPAVVAEDASSEDDSDADAPDEEDDGETVDVDATDDIDEESESAVAKLDVSFSSSINGKAQWTAWFNGRPVATCTAADAGKNADVFATNDFGRAVMLASKHAGIKTTLKEMGFKPLVTSVSTSSIIKKEVETQVATARAQITTEHNEFQERFKAALATAAVGVTRGFFTGVENPLKNSLQQALASAGVRNPDVLLHQAFKASADQYHKMLFAKASDIMTKPAEVQESLAKAVLEVNYVETTASAQTNVTEDRLASMGTTASVNQEQPAQRDSTSSSDGKQGNAFTTTLSRVVSSLGRGGRF